MSRLLLDTCAIFDAAEGFALPAKVIKRIEEAADQGELFVSIVTAIEVNNVTSISRSHPKILLPTPEAWYNAAVQGLRAREVALTKSAIFAAGRLGSYHGDPFDRMLMATANELNATLVTCDTVLPRYELAGLVRLLRY